MDDLNFELKQLFIEKGFHREFKANELIFMENDKDSSLFYIEEGLIKISMISDEGKEKTLFLLNDGQVFGEVSLIDGLEHDVNAETLKNTAIYTLKEKDIKQIVMERPEISLNLLRVMADKIRLMTQQVRDMVFSDIAGRLASQLLQFDAQFGRTTEGGQLIQLSLTHQELANLLGASRVTITKTLNQFVDEGILQVVNRQLLIKDIVALRSYIS